MFIARKMYDKLRKQVTNIFGREQHKTEKNSETAVANEECAQNKGVSGCPFASATKSASGMLAQFKATKGRVIILCK